MAAAVVVLTFDALVRERGGFDYDLMRIVRHLNFPGDRAILTFVSDLTGQPWAVVIWAVFLGSCLVARRWLVGTMLLTFPLAGGVNMAIRELVGRSRPHPDALNSPGDIATMVEAFPGNDFVSFPSGHVVGAVLLYGFVFVLADGIRWRPASLAIRAWCVSVIVLSGVARVWLGNHWVGDVATGYALGGVFLLGTIRAYWAMAPSTANVRLVKATPVPHDDALPHAHALTSTVLFRDGRVLKIYNPGFVPRILYWGAFQAPFAYAHNRRALEAAVLRRNLAGMLTEYWYGSDRVAVAQGVEEVDGRFAIVSRFTEGTPPTDHAAARHFLGDLAQRFDSAGLPTWQIDPRQPRSMGNLLEGPEGEFTIIDLESGIVSPLASPRAWVRAIRRAQVPFYDDVYFDVTRRYIASEADSITKSKGEAWLAELEELLGRAEQAANDWHAAEPRVWSRTLRLVWQGFGIPRFPAWVRGKATAGRERAVTWIEASITRWEAEGRLAPEESVNLRASLREPSIQAVLPHLGVHLLIGVALRFPVGTILRVTYTVANLLLATLRLLFRRISLAAWRREFGIHSPLVILVAAMPGVGTFAYLASVPILRHMLLARVALDAVGEKLPAKVYRRSGVKRLIVRPRIRESNPAPANGLRPQMPK